VKSAFSFSQSELYVLLALASDCIILTVVMSPITVKVKFTLRTGHEGPKVE